jgi:hypothetical protein
MWQILRQPKSIIPPNLASDSIHISTNITWVILEYNEITIWCIENSDLNFLSNEMTKKKLIKL